MVCCLDHTWMSLVTEQKKQLLLDQLYYAATSLILLGFGREAALCRCFAHWWPAEDTVCMAACKTKSQGVVVVSNVHTHKHTNEICLSNGDWLKQKGNTVCVLIVWLLLCLILLYGNNPAVHPAAVFLCEPFNRSYSVGTCHVQFFISLRQMSFVRQDCHLVVLSVLHTAARVCQELTASTLSRLVQLLYLLTVPASTA